MYRKGRGTVPFNSCLRAYYWLGVFIFVGDVVFYSFWPLGVHSYAVLLADGG